MLKAKVLLLPFRRCQLEYWKYEAFPMLLRSYWICRRGMWKGYHFWLWFECEQLFLLGAAWK